ncbi:hypothetical protein OAN33_04790 [Flavobacteriales bacterium]|nr:hypothetical protein [Flavobacteriales bacterium]
MRIILVIFILYGFSTQIESQSDTDTIFHPKQKIGFGISNVAKTIGVSLNDSNPFPKTIQYMAEYHHEIDTALYIRFGVSSAISSVKNGNLREYYFVPLNFNLGVEKLVSLNKFDFIYGADIFYTMSLRGGSQIGTGMWQGDDFGFGVAPIGGIDYNLNKEWIVGIELELGVGLFREFRNVGNLPRQNIKGGLIYPRLLSLSFKYLLWNS